MTVVNILDRLKQKNHAVCNILVKVHVNEVQVYGAAVALMMQITENQVNVSQIPTTAYVFVRPGTFEDHHIFRVIWRKDGKPFSANWIEKEANPKIGSNGVPFHDFINGLYQVAKPDEPELIVARATNVKPESEGPTAA